MLPPNNEPETDNDRLARIALIDAHIGERLAAMRAIIAPPQPWPVARWRVYWARFMAWVRT
jgi:hypothetical protein